MMALSISQFTLPGAPGCKGDFNQRQYLTGPVSTAKKLSPVRIPLKPDRIFSAGELNLSELCYNPDSVFFISPRS